MATSMWECRAGRQPLHGASRTPALSMLGLDHLTTCKREDSFALPPGLELECGMLPVSPLSLDQAEVRKAPCALRGPSANVEPSQAVWSGYGASPLPLLLGRTCPETPTKKSLMKNDPASAVVNLSAGTPDLNPESTSAFCLQPSKLGEHTAHVDESLSIGTAHLTCKILELLGQVDQESSSEVVEEPRDGQQVKDVLDRMQTCERVIGSPVQQTSQTASAAQLLDSQAPLSWSLTTQPSDHLSHNPEFLSTLAPPRAFSNAPAQFNPSPPSVFDAAAAGFNSGLPGAATIAAALSSAMHGLQVPRRQQNHECDESPGAATIASYAAPWNSARHDVQGPRSQLVNCEKNRRAPQPPMPRGAATDKIEAPPGLSQHLASSSLSSPGHGNVCPMVETRSEGVVPTLQCIGVGKASGEESAWLERNMEVLEQEGNAPRGRRFACKFVFTGIDLHRDADFELVPRLIGRRGEHMRKIAEECKGKVRIRGRGSGHKEQHKGRTPLEADVPLQIALSCTDRRSFEKGRSLVTQFLQGMTLHFERYCKRSRIDPVPALYTVVGDS